MSIVAADRSFSVVVGSGRTFEKLWREDNSIVERIVDHRSAVYVNLPFEFRPQGLPVALEEVTQIVGFAPLGSHFLIDLHPRRVEIAGIAPIPDGLWMQQLASNLIDDFNGYLRGTRYVIHDRDQLCAKHFRELPQRAGNTPLRLPPRSPNLNANAWAGCSLPTTVMPHDSSAQ